MGGGGDEGVGLGLWLNDGQKNLPLHKRGSHPQGGGPLGKKRWRGQFGFPFMRDSKGGGGHVSDWEIIWL